MKMHFENILVPTDFSESSMFALKQSFNIARQTKLDITLLHVNSPGLSKLFFSLFSEEEKKKYSKQYEKSCKEKLESIATEASKESGITIKPMLVKGKVYEQIIETAKLISAKYIIINAKGDKTESKSMISSNTLKLLKTANCPVITIGARNLRDGCNNIILPLDLTKETRQKVSMAIEFAKLYNSKIKVVSALLTDKKDVVTKLKYQLEQVKNFILKNNIACTVTLLHEEKSKEHIIDAILDFAVEKEGDLMIIMTQQEVAWAHFFVGSTAQRIIRNSKIPVMSVRPIDLGKKTGFTS